jgi:hypothetical protein
MMVRCWMVAGRIGVGVSMVSHYDDRWIRLALSLALALSMALALDCWPRR